MKKLAISLAVGASALFASAAYASPLSNGIIALPDGNIQNVRTVCNENGRCWRERGERRVIRERDSYDYAPRERYIERRGYDRGYYDEPRAGFGFSAPGVSVGVGTDRW
jgi:predicted secreted protein